MPAAATPMPVTMISFITLGLLSRSSAWSHHLRAPSHHFAHRHDPNRHSRRHAPSFARDSADDRPPRFRTPPSSATPSDLSSAYDGDLPAALVGEAVRSALRSDRGICFDFSTDRYARAGGGASPGNAEGGSRLVSVVAMLGAGTKPFLNAKFSQSTSNDVEGDDAGDGAVQLTPQTALVRRGHAFETAYLTSKGRMIDRLLVLEFPSPGPGDGEPEDGGTKAEDAFLITSPGNAGTALHDELSPLVFPMDEVALTRCSSPRTSVIALACSSLRGARTSFDKNILGLLMGGDSYSREFEFPEGGACHHYRVSGGSRATTDVYVTEHAFLSPEMCRGYTLLLREGADPDDAPTLADRIWDNLTDEENDEGPVGVGSLEYDTLRVEAGLPGYGNEMTGDGPKKKRRSRNKTTEKSAERDEGVDDKHYAKSNPLELHLQRLIDTDKGCYQGQEGIASMLKNKRGFPRLLYQAVFYDAENDFDDEGSFGLLSTDTRELLDFRQLTKQADPLSNDTRQPSPGDDIYVLGSGSNESKRISVGKITSVAEPNGMGDAKTIALALAGRPGPILKAIKDQGLELPRWWEDVGDGDDGRGDADGGVGRGIAGEKGGSGIMRPPPLDPLHNLEIVVGGTYTVGRLVSVPGRRYGVGSGGDDAVAALLDYERRGEVTDAKDGAGYFLHEFEDEVEGADAGVTENLQSVESDLRPEGEIDGDDDDEEITDKLLAKAEEEAAKAAAEAEVAAAESKRKEEKMNLLKAKAEAAMAARRKKKEDATKAEAAQEEAAAATETNRKDEKMKLLKARAEAAMAARRGKKE